MSERMRKNAGKFYDLYDGGEMAKIRRKRREQTHDRSGSGRGILTGREAENEGWGVWRR